MDIPYMIMMVGLPGCGKSTFAKLITVEGIDDDGNPISKHPKIHSSDALRAELYGSEDSQEHNSELFDELHRRIKEDLRNGNDVIYDATNIEKKRRIAFLKSLNNIPCYKSCVCMIVPFNLCLERNAKRERRVPSHAVRKMYLNWCPPDYSEGFDSVSLYCDYGGKENSKDYTVPHLFIGENGIDTYDQDNEHHSLTLGLHCRKAAEYVSERWPDNKRLITAALIHDIGKPFCRSEKNGKGEVDGDAHYFQHQCVGAYDSLLYTNTMSMRDDDRFYIANLIFYHMRPHMAWKQSEKAERKDREVMGEQMYRDVLRLHEADLSAH